MPVGAITLADITSADWSLMLDFSSPLWQSAPAAPPDFDSVEDIDSLSDVDTQTTLPYGAGLGNVVQGIDDVNQCLAIILTTPLGSDPLRPDFGADLWQYIDAPINAAIPQIVATVTAAITKWEPRVKLLSVTAVPVLTGAQAGAQMQLSLTWQLNLASAPIPAQTTTINIGAAANV